MSNLDFVYSILHTIFVQWPHWFLFLYISNPGRGFVKFFGGAFVGMPANANINTPLLKSYLKSLSTYPEGSSISLQKCVRTQFVYPPPCLSTNRTLLAKPPGLPRPMVCVRLLWMAPKNLLYFVISLRYS